MPGILIDCLRKYQRLSQTPLESTRAPVHFLMLGGAGQAVPTIDAYISNKILDTIASKRTFHQDFYRKGIADFHRAGSY